MKRRIGRIQYANGLTRARSLAAPAVVGLSLCFGIPAQAQSWPDSSLVPDLVDLMESAGIPGISLAVVEGGSLGGTLALGVRDTGTGAPVTDSTVFEAASLSKPVTAYVALRLVDEGALDLDRPLQELLPNPRLEGDSRYDRITARMVLSHTTGLPNWGSDTLRLGFEPGDHFSYSGEGYVYLAQVMETLTNRSLVALAREDVFEPLEMTSSSFVWVEAYDAVSAVGHDELSRAQAKRKPVEPNAAASLHTTATDYARFLAAVLQGRGLSESSARLLRTAAVRFGGEEPFSLRKDRSVWEELGWSLGWGIRSSGSGDLIWHWGDNGAFKALVVGNPATGDGFVYFANSTSGLAIADAVADRLDQGLGRTMDWLGYERHDAPGRAERRTADRLQAEKRYREAVAMLERAIEKHPDSETLRRRIDWLGHIIEVRENPLSVPRRTLAAYAGRYGPRRVMLEGDDLYYQRDPNPRYRMIPMSQDTFMLDGLDEFRVRVITDEDGIGVALEGIYLNGDRDRTDRAG
jgi:CubicO group peptidase (beta-lactamase class C family)